MARPSTHILGALLGVLAVAAATAADDAPGLVAPADATPLAADTNGTTNGTAGTAAAAYFPASWPTAPAGSVVLVHLSFGFAAGAAVDCARPSYPGSAKRVSAYAAKAMARMVKLHDSQEGDEISHWASFAAVKAGSSCQSPDGQSEGGIETFVAIKVRKASFLAGTAKHVAADALHLADLCPTDPKSYPNAAAASFDDLCTALGGGKRLAYARACVLDAPPADEFVVGRAAGLQ